MVHSLGHMDAGTPFSRTLQLSPQMSTACPFVPDAVSTLGGVQTESDSPSLQERPFQREADFVSQMQSGSSPLGT